MRWLIEQWHNGAYVIAMLTLFEIGMIALYLATGV